MVVSYSYTMFSSVMVALSYLCSCFYIKIRKHGYAVIVHLCSNLFQDVLKLRIIFTTTKLFVQVTSVMSMWTRMQPSYAANMWNEALNKRLGTEVILRTPVIDVLSLFLSNFVEFVQVLSFFMI